MSGNASGALIHRLWIMVNRYQKGGQADTLLSIAASAYSFGRIEWPGRDIVFYFTPRSILEIIVIPGSKG